MFYRNIKSAAWCWHVNIDMFSDVHMDCVTYSSKNGVALSRGSSVQSSQLCLGSCSGLQDMHDLGRHGHQYGRRLRDVCYAKKPKRL